MSTEQPPDNGRPDETEAGLMMSNTTRNKTNNQPKPKKIDGKAKSTEPLS